MYFDPHFIMPTLGEVNMADIGKLSNQEKIFLAGCIEGIVFMDGVNTETEAGELNIIVSRDFPDFDEKLAEFDKQVKDNEGFWELAKNITNSASQDIILQILNELILQSGFLNNKADQLIEKLKEIWV
jgi:hypothetical protein